MHQEKCAERNDAGYLVQLAKQKSFAEFYRHLSSLFFRFSIFSFGIAIDILNSLTENRKRANRKSFDFYITLLF